MLTCLPHAEMECNSYAYALSVIKTGCACVMLTCLLHAEMECNSYAHALSVIKTGCASRSVGATHLNERSSRAHTIVRVQIEGWSEGRPQQKQQSSSHGHRSALAQGVAGEELHSTALLHFVDLAGSERLARTGSSGIRCAPSANKAHTQHAVIALWQNILVDRNNED